MCAKDLGHAIKLANQTGYGLTSGLESLDNREQDFWKSRIKAGNLYINKGTTGAVVLRQPFGGMGKSALGAGIKAGGPNYVIQFTDVADRGFPGQDTVQNDHPLLLLCQKIQQEIKSGNRKEFEEDLGKTVSAVKSYITAYQNEFSKEKDYFHLRGQDNIVRYLPKKTVVVRIHDEDSLFEILARIAAVKVAGSHLIISMPYGLKSSPFQILFQDDGKKFFENEEILFQSDHELTAIMPQINLIRYAAKSRVPDVIFTAAALKGFYISSTKVVMEGRVELLQYYREQSICNSYHRYGNLGERSEELEAF
jgi:RHH-type proline utilization regulon transcriptional repressor/proline dehydrogenase/delta 1-pyrroline-5-carboxylate dehydrogenase